MDHGTLYDTYKQARGNENLEELRALVPLIHDEHPQAAEMLNCCGYKIGQHAEDLEELWAGVRLIERAEPLTDEPLMQVKIHGNLALFYVLGNRPEAALAAVQRALAIRLNRAEAWRHGSVYYQAGQARRLLGDDIQAQRELEAALTYPMSEGMVNATHVQLAGVVARLGDVERSQVLLQTITDVAWLPYMTGVRARLALVTGQHEAAVMLARASVAAFTAIKPQPLNWFPTADAWWLYRECLLAAGYHEDAAVAEQRWLELAEHWAYQNVDGGLF